MHLLGEVVVILAVCICSDRPLEVPSVLGYNSGILPNGNRCSERKIAGFGNAV